VTTCDSCGELIMGKIVGFCEWCEQFEKSEAELDEYIHESEREHFGLDDIEIEKAVSE
jgi:hypothetical protein